MTDDEHDGIDFDELSYNELRTMCKESTPPLSASGNRDVLIKRLLDSEADSGAGTGDEGSDPPPTAPAATAHKARKGELLFEVDDPFAAGALRSEGVDDRLPCRLDTKAVYAKGVLTNYVLRARGGCRDDLARLIVKVLDKNYPGWAEKPKKQPTTKT